MIENNINQDKQYLPFLSKEQLEQIKETYTNLRVLPTYQTQILFSKIRDQQTTTSHFRRYADRLMRLLIETALNIQQIQHSKKESPCSFYDSYELLNEKDFIAVTIMRAGNSFLHELLQIMPEIDVGQILLQRDETTKEKKPILYYTKLPKNIANKKILLFDPMIATGGSVVKAIEELIKVGVQEQDITFVNLISCEYGLEKLFSKYPNIQVVTGNVDPILIEETKYIAPGLGDFGDRYFGTNQQH